MLSGRMLKILEYLQANKTITYHQISKDLKLKERVIRYDIDKINDYLSSVDQPVIIKKSKGVIELLQEIVMDDFNKNQQFVYSSKERIALMIVELVFNANEFKISRLSELFDVSRSTIKNDLELLEKQLENYHAKIKYDRCFYLDISSEDEFLLMSDILIKYIYLFKNNDFDLNPFEKLIREGLTKVFEKINLMMLVNWCDISLHELNSILNHCAYLRYCSVIIIFVWHTLNNKEIQIKPRIKPQKMERYITLIETLETIIKQTIPLRERQVLVSVLNFSDSQIGVDNNFIEQIMKQLINEMSKARGIDFSKDRILIKNLWQHINMLVKRINSRFDYPTNAYSLLSDKDKEVFVLIKKLAKKIVFLDRIENDDELTYLTIYFITSEKRLIKKHKKRVLIVCHHGYGCSTMIRESLINQYNVEVIDTVAIYQLSTYSRFDEIDYIISSTQLDDSYGKKYVVVNPIFIEDDFMKLEKIGLSRKQVSNDLLELAERIGLLGNKRVEEVELLLKDNVDIHLYI